MSSAVPRLQLLAAALLFSTGGAAIKLTTLSSWQLAGFRSGAAALVLLLLVPAWRQFWRPRAVLVGAAYAATMILFVAGNKLTTAANTIFLQSTAPLYLMLLGPLLLRERAHARDLPFAAALACGLGLFFVGSERPFATAPDPASGNLLGALSGLTWALTLLGLRWLGRTVTTRDADPAGAAVVAGNLIAFAFCLPFALPVVASSSLDWVATAYLGTFQIAVAYLFMTRGLRQLRAVEASLLILLEPVLNALFTWLVHGEQPGPWSLLGCGVILVATLSRALFSGHDESRPAGEDRRMGPTHASPR